MANIQKLQRRAEQHFDSGERAMFTLLGVYETKVMGTDSVRNGILIATNQRVIFYAKRVTGFDLEAFPYPKISSVEMGKNLMGYHVKIVVSGNSAEMKWIKVGDVGGFVSSVKERIGRSTEVSSHTGNAQPGLEDPIVQLERLRKLYEAGVLTEDEFTAKKAEMLARI